VSHFWSIISVNLSSSNGIWRTWNAKHYSVIFTSITTLAPSVQFTNPLSGEIRAEKINWARTVTAVCASGALAHTSREWTESRNLITASPHAWHTRERAFIFFSTKKRRRRLCKSRAAVRYLNKQLREPGRRVIICTAWSLLYMWAPIYNPPAQHFPASCNDDDSVRRQREDMWASASDSFAVFWAASLARRNARYAVRALNFYFYICILTYGKETISDPRCFSFSL
jgi:hypothetical protein